jgi:4-aminobutyrate aminotransferase-like enzyme/Ser/Thr protein kinase RdoA (MazF antagonist)
VSSADEVLARRPQVDARQAERIARERFRIDGRASELPSERDRNFRIDTGNARFVLKIAARGEDVAVLDLQHAVLQRVRERAPHLAVPRPLADVDGALIVESGAHAVRLLTWLPGTPLCEVRPHGRDLWRSIGRFLAELDAALEGFAHPAIDRALFWDPRAAPDVIRAHLAAIEPAAHRALVEELLAGSEPAARAPLRIGVIHNDANDHNVLVEVALDGARMCGLIDFGDLVRSFVAAEVAVAAAYAMLDERDPLAAAAGVAAGYHEARALTAAELDALSDLIALRLCTSVALSAERRARAPHERYLTVSEAPAWRLLRKLGMLPLRAALRQACGLPASARRAAFARWLGAGPALHRVVDVDLASAEALDLGVASFELADPRDLAQAHALVAAALQRAPAAFGGYGEARLLYQTRAFDERTVHLGIDVWAAAGTAVYAPLDGTVHGFADNAAPLDYGPTILLRHEPAPGVVFFTLYGHLARESLEGLEVGARIARSAKLGAIGSEAVNGGWPPHLHFQVILDVLGATSDFPGVAAADQRALWLELCPDPAPLLGLPPTPPPPSDLRAARARHLSAALSLSYRAPLHIVRGRGAHLFDRDGRAFLDAVNNVPHVGHCHPHVVRAGQRQMALLNTNTRYLHEGVVDYARRLLATFPPPLEVVFFVNSGSEANELALRLARAHTGACDCIVLDGAYHGNTSALIDLSPYKHDGPGGRGRPDWVHAVAMPDPYRSEESAAQLAEHVARAAHGRRTAAFFAEPLLGCGGQIVPPKGYFVQAYAHARAAGALCIADEVQTGLGRVGSHFWAFETHAVVPDVVTLGKPLGNGHPLAAVVTTRAIARSFENGMEFFSTFGGNPVSCAIGAAVLDVIEREGLQQHARELGAWWLGELRAIADRAPLIGDVRGLGLFLGVELVRDRDSREPAAAEASYVVERMRAQGILLSIDGPLHNVLKIKPPLVFSRGDAERFCRTLDAVLGETPLQRRR